MSIVIAPRFAGITQFEQCVNGARMTVDGFDADGDLGVDAPNDPIAVGAIQSALKDLGYGLLVTFIYDPATAEVVRQFKNDQQLAVPPGLAAHDGVVGPGTSGRLNALFTAPPTPSPPPSPVPAPPALQAWERLISFRPPGRCRRASTPGSGSSEGRRASCMQSRMREDRSIWISIPSGSPHFRRAGA